MGKKHLIHFRVVVYIIIIFLLFQSINTDKSDSYSKQKITVGNNLTVSKHYKFSYYSLSCYLDDYGQYNKMFHIFGQGQLEGMNLTFKLVSISISVDSTPTYSNSNLTIPVRVIHSGDTVQYNLTINVFSNISKTAFESRYLWTNVKVSYLITEIMKSGNFSQPDSLENYSTYLLTTTSPAYSVRANSNNNGNVNLLQFVFGMIILILFFFLLYLILKPIFRFLSKRIKNFHVRLFLVRCEKDQRFLMNKLEELEGIDQALQKANFLTLKEKGEEITQNLSENNNLNAERRELFSQFHEYLDQIDISVIFQGIEGIEQQSVELEVQISSEKEKIKEELLSDFEIEFENLFEDLEKFTTYCKSITGNTLFDNMGRLEELNELEYSSIFTQLRSRTFEQRRAHRQHGMVSDFDSFVNCMERLFFPMNDFLEKLNDYKEKNETLKGLEEGLGEIRNKLGDFKEHIRQLESEIGNEIELAS